MTKFTKGLRNLPHLYSSTIVDPEWDEDDGDIWFTMGDASDLVEIDRPRLPSMSEAAHRAYSLRRVTPAQCGFAIPSRKGGE